MTSKITIHKWYNLAFWLLSMFESQIIIKFLSNLWKLSSKSLRDSTWPAQQWEAMKALELKAEPGTLWEAPFWRTESAGCKCE